MPDPQQPLDIAETPDAVAEESPKPVAPEAATGLARTAQILGFLLKYRRAGVFAGLDGDLGDAPLTLEAIVNDNVPLLPRSPATEVMKQIKADLDAALQ